MSAIPSRVEASMPIDDYHADREHLSASVIKTLLKNPHEYWEPADISQSPSIIIGKAVHTLVLEPYLFDKEFALRPDVDRRTKAGKEAYAAFEAEVGDKTILTLDQLETISATAKAITAEPAISDLLFSHGVAEMSVFGEIDGVKVKCRPDYYREDLGIIVDLKTTQDASPNGFSRQVANYLYFVQAALYIDLMRSVGKPVEKFVFVAASTSKPHMVGVYELSDPDIELGRSLYRKAFEIFAKIDRYKRPIYMNSDDKVVQTISLPTYIHYEYEGL